MSEVALEFELSPIGWAKFSLRIGDERFNSDEVSYSTDVLGDFLRLGIMAASGGGSGEIVFDYEPGGLRLVSRRAPGLASAEGLAVDIYEFGRSLDDSRLRFQARCHPDAFAAAALEMGLQALERYGLEGYAETWASAFPSRALEVLKSAVAATAQNQYMTSIDSEIVTSLHLIE